MPGPKPQPTALKLYKGETRTERLNKNEPKPKLTAPVCPDYLDIDARKVWDELAPKLERLGILTEIDGLAFTALCIEWSEYIRLRTMEGDSIQTFESGATQVAPQVSISHKCLTQLMKLFAAFGLTPSDRGRLSISPVSDDDDMGDLL
jgi:P27 family predicted phage terminase small subunit